MAHGSVTLVQRIPYRADFCELLAGAGSAPEWDQERILEQCACWLERNACELWGAFDGRGSMAGLKPCCTSSKGAVWRRTVVTTVRS